MTKWRPASASAVREAGARIVASMSPVVGFDRQRSLASRLWPALTTVVLPIRLMRADGLDAALGDALNGARKAKQSR